MESCAMPVMRLCESPCCVVYRVKWASLISCAPAGRASTTENNKYNNCCIPGSRSTVVVGTVKIGRCLIWEYQLPVVAAGGRRWENQTGRWCGWSGCSADLWYKKLLRRVKQKSRTANYNALPMTNMGALFFRINIVSVYPAQKRAALLYQRCSQ